MRALFSLSHPNKTNPMSSDNGIPAQRMGCHTHVSLEQRIAGCVVALMRDRFRTGWVLLAASWLLSFQDAASGQTPPTSFETYLRKSAVDKQTLDVFLDPKQLSWAKFDPVTGYRLGNYMPRDGIDRSATISTIGSNGMRTAHAYVGRPCRINTYGDSFTLCHQVSDSETWQEYLAGHL